MDWDYPGLRTAVNVDGVVNSRSNTDKGWTLELPAGQTRTLLKRHSLREVTTRRLYAGRHEIELQVNGRSVARAAFRLSVP